MAPQFPIQSSQRLDQHRFHQHEPAAFQRGRKGYALLCFACLPQCLSGQISCTGELTESHTHPETWALSSEGTVRADELNPWYYKVSANPGCLATELAGS